MAELNSSSTIFIHDGNSTLEIPCNISESIVGSPYFTILLVGEMVASAVGTVANLLLAVLVWRLRIVHANLRWLMAHLSFVLSWFAVVTFVKAVRLVIAATGRFGTGACGLVSAAYTCRLEEFPHVIAITSTTYSLISILLERFYSTVRYRTYDRSSSRPWMAALLIPTIWTASLLYQLAGLRSETETEGAGGALMPLCENVLSVGRDAAAARLLSTIVVELVGIVLSILIHFYNDRKLESMCANRAQHTLTSRFQISQNVKLNRFIVPSTLLMVCCYLPNHVFLLWVVYGLRVDFAVRTYLVHVNYLWKLFYCIAHPILVFKRSPDLRIQFRKRFAVCFIDRSMWAQKTGQVSTVEAERSGVATALAVVSPGMVTVGEAHFELLSKIWSHKAKSGDKR